MAQENNQQNQESTPKNTNLNQEKTADSESSAGQTAQTQTTGSAAAVKKYDAAKKSEESSSTGVMKEFYDKAKQSAGQVTDKAAGKLDEKKTVVTEGLSGVADSLRQVGENLRGSGTDDENPIAQFTGKYGDALANQVESVSEYFDSKNVREIVRDVETFARRNPAVFIGGAFALGILAARFLKSSSPQKLNKGKGRSFAASSSGGGESEAGTNPS